MRSMTGFGRGEAKDDRSGIAFDVEVFSVNRKQFDLRLNLPRELSSYEPVIRKMVSDSVSRGAITVRVTPQLEPIAMQSLIHVNEDVARGLVAKCQDLQKDLSLPGEITINDILQLPGVVEEAAPDYNQPELLALFKQALNTALKGLITMRDQEGAQLKLDLLERLGTLSEFTDRLEPLAASIPDQMKEKLLKRLEDNQLAVGVDDERVLREVVIYSDKSDVSEEITRLRSHIEQFKSFADKTKPIGRSLDFLAQEFNREITTLGNKAGSPEVSVLVVEFKTELEKIREQVQNVE